MPSRPGIRLELATELDAGAVQRVEALFDQMGLRGSHPRKHRARLTVTGEGRRLDLLTRSPLGSNVSLIATAGSAFWVQHEARVFLPLDQEQPKKKKARGRTATLRMAMAPAQQAPVEPERPVPPRKRPVDGDPVATLTDAATGQSVRLTATLNPEWRAPELAMALVTALYGGPAGELPPGLDARAWANAFASRGFPERYQVETTGPDGETVVLSRTRVTSFRVETIADRDLQPPAGYRRWSLKAKPPKRTARGYTKLPPQEFAVTTEPLPVSPVYPETPATPPAGSGGGSSADVGVSRQALDNEDYTDGEREPIRPPKRPRPVAATTLVPRIGLRIDQLMLNHIAALFNAAITPIRTIGIGQGEVTLDWLTQLRADVLRRGANAPGTAVFEMLHDVALPATRVTPAPTPASDFGVFSCRGLIDQVALRDAEARFRGGTYPQTITMTFAPSMRNVINGAGANWDLLPDGVKARLAFELVRRDYGVIKMPFPTGTGPKPILGLLNVQAMNVNGSLTLPPVPPAAIAGDPPFNPLLTLTASPGGVINGTLSLGSLSLTANIARWGTWELYLLIAAGHLAWVLLPAFAWALFLVSGLALLLAQDITYAALGAVAVTAALTIRFVRDAAGVFIPSVSCTVGGTFVFAWMSYVPTGIHQVLAAIESAIVLELRGSIITALANGIAGEVARAARGFLGAGFPATALRLGLPVGGGSTGGVSGQFTYLEAELDPSRDARFAIAPVPTPRPLETAQRADVTRARPRLGADHYGSLSFDENFLNVALAGMRMARLLDGFWNGASSNAIAALIPPPIPRPVSGRLYLGVDSNPVMTLSTVAGTGPHGGIRLPYRLTISRASGDRVATIRFEVTTTAQLVLGSAVAPGDSTGFVRIVTLADRAFDLLLDLPSSVTAVSLDLVQVQEVRTVTFDRDENGKPHRTVEIERIETTSPVAMTPALAQALDPLLRRVVADAWWARRTSRAPRRDGFVPGAQSTGTVDPTSSLRYPLGDLDPDAVVNQPNVRVEIGLERRLAHFHLGHAGFATLALMPVRSAGPLPVLATLNGSNWARGILAGVVVQASTMSDRPLTL